MSRAWSGIVEMRFIVPEYQLVVTMDILLKACTVVKRNRGGAQTFQWG